MTTQPKTPLHQNPVGQAIVFRGLSSSARRPQCKPIPVLEPRRQTIVLTFAPEASAAATSTHSRAPRILVRRTVAIIRVYRR